MKFFSVKYKTKLGEKKFYFLCLKSKFNFFLNEKIIKLIFIRKKNRKMKY